KEPPYELYADPGKPWNFGAGDASLIARLGVNGVRLGMTWSGLEPGTASANDPALCAPTSASPARASVASASGGAAASAVPSQFTQAVLDQYVTRLAKTVDLLGRFHIY